MEITNRIEKLTNAISYKIYEKEEIFKLAMLALLSDESIFLLGKPGIAKSLISRRMKFALKKANIFEYLMNKFSTPEEIYGPIDIKGLQNGVYERIITGYLPTAEIGFLDEIWKAGPSIQNTLLTVINEKIFRNGGRDIKVPLHLLISASNELPAEGEGLEALFDRFIIRYVVEGLKDKENFEQLINGDSPLDVSVDSNLQISAEELDDWRKKRQQVNLSRDVIDFIHYFRNKLQLATNGEAYISDRRWKKISELIKTSAFFNGRMTADIPDIFIIPHCIWNNEMEYQDYTKLFEQAFLEKFGSEWRNQKQTLLNKVEELAVQIDQVETQYLRLTPFMDPFRGKLQGTYYRIQIQNVPQEKQIALILASDWNKLVSVPDSSLKINIYFGANLNRYSGAETFDAQFHKGDQINLISINQKAVLTNENPVEYNKKIEQLNVQMESLEKEVKEISAKMYKAYKKYTSEDCIFFDHTYKEQIAKAFDISLNSSSRKVTSNSNINEEEF
ncbi:AAA family ATPase [Spiroplasma endosymbiont of Labia minor]|uniref:AAA family ATPase n=1 Tax=Spiroplasma endosymbiont of Labia minor TaxID=3066305 RepID=UPI0030D02620